MALTTLFYDSHDDVAVAARLRERGPAGAPSIFLAGPTARGVLRTAWRARALELLAEAFDGGVVVLPEFRAGRFEERVGPVFGGRGESPVPGMRAASYHVLAWETAAIESVDVVLFWMPFALAADEHDPASLPGFTTRAEVSRELARDPSRVVLGMPAGALSGSHIRYHAHHAGLAVHGSLEDTVGAAVRAARGRR